LTYMYLRRFLKRHGELLEQSVHGGGAGGHQRRNDEVAMALRLEVPRQLVPPLQPACGVRSSYRLGTLMQTSPYAPAELTTPSKMDTNCTIPSLIPTVTGNMVRSFYARATVHSQGSSTTVSRSHNIHLNILTPRLTVWSGEGALNGRCFPIYESILTRSYCSNHLHDVVERGQVLSG
jgi:hypothetical protein